MTIETDVRTLKNMALDTQELLQVFDRITSFTLARGKNSCSSGRDVDELLSAVCKQLKENVEDKRILACSTEQPDKAPGIFG